MAAIELTLNQLQLDTPVYDKDNELAGRLRYVYAEAEAPYTVRSFVLDRGNLGGNINVPITEVNAFQEGQGGQRITLSLSNDELAQLPEYVVTASRPSRDYREQSGGYKRNNRQRQGRRPYGNRRPLQDR